ncbi:MAG: GNAT family N-acetyltransferase [Haloarculaceae archaeon]
MTADVHRVETPGEREDALDVRRAVFIEEQGVSEEIEIDDREQESIHFVAYADGEPVGAARLRELDDATGKAERVAVLRSHRGEGFGRRLMTTLEATASDRGLTEMVLHAQTRVEEFYAALGYETTSGEFQEAGIPHVEMRKSLATDDE